MGELVDFLKWTDWRMETPKAYGTFHLVFFFVGLALSVILAYALRNTDSKQNRAVLLSVGIILLVSELYKQLYYTYVIGQGSYQWWIFPFQLCSIPMYLCLILPFLKDGKLKNSLYDFMLAFNLMGGFVAFIEPSGLVHDRITLTWHAFIWHMLLVFLGLYIGFSKRAGLKLSDYKRAVAVFAVLCVISFSINLIFFNLSNGSINMFYVGPADSPIIVFKSISEKFGWYVNTPLYMLSLCLAAFVFYLPFTLANKKHKLNISKEQLVT